MNPKPVHAEGDTMKKRTTLKAMLAATAAPGLAFAQAKPPVKLGYISILTDITEHRIEVSHAEVTRRIGDQLLASRSIEQAAEVLSSARPTAVNLRWAVRRMLRVVQGSAEATVAELRSALIAEAEAGSVRETMEDFSLDEIVEGYERGIRNFVILKSRQLGISTISIALDLVFLFYFKFQKHSLQ